jgi:phospholipid/cholesterol/gamma-HCH transport system ATP-binding protein
MMDPSPMGEASVAASSVGRAGLEMPLDLVVLEDVWKAYGDVPVLEGLSLRVPRGKVCVVLGGSGSGKSTMLRLLLGLEEYDRGSVQLMGREVKSVTRDEHSELMMQLGMLFQFGALLDSMTVFENVGFALRHVRHMTEEEIHQVVRQNLLMVGLKDVEHLYPPQLSGGMKKRVALARAISHQPKLLLADEPTTGLDPIMADTINELILQMRERLGVTVLCISHDIGAAFRIADRISLLYQGRVIESGTPDQIRESSNPVVQQFVAGRAHGPITP